MRFRTLTGPTGPNQQPKPHRTDTVADKFNIWKTFQKLHLNTFLIENYRKKKLECFVCTSLAAENFATFDRHNLSKIFLHTQTVLNYM